MTIFKGKILILNGPNLNMLGIREPEIYGHETLNDIETLCEQTANNHNLDIDFRQSNHEGELVDWIQQAREIFEGVVMNAGAYTHTSLAIHDALKLLDVPIIEVHISNPKEREEFRHHSYIEPLAHSVFAGHGSKSYVIAINVLADLIKA